MRILEDDHQAWGNYPLPHVAIAALALLTLSACQTPQQRAVKMEDNLAVAGFRVRPADTPDREAMIRSLPMSRFVQLMQGGHLKYVYTDPLVCNCLYVGSRHSYGQYKKHMLQHRLADEAQLTASTYSEPSWNWSDWDPSQGHSVSWLHLGSG